METLTFKQQRHKKHFFGPLMVTQHVCENEYQYNYFVIYYIKNLNLF